MKSPFFEEIDELVTQAKDGGVDPKLITAGYALDVIQEWERNDSILTIPPTLESVQAALDEFWAFAER